MRVAEARKSAILEAALDCVITIDHEGDVVEFNPAAERTFGYTREKVLGRNMAELIIPPAFRSRHADGLARYLATRQGPILGKRLEFTAQRADGEEFPVELAITTVEVNGKVLFSGYLRDLTEQHRVRDELAESHELLRSMLDNSPALITITDADGRYRFINQPLADRYGLDRDRAIGRTAEDIWPQAAAGNYRAKDLEVLRTGQPLQYEAVAASDTGDRVYLTVKFPIFDPVDAVLATASIATDITELKQAQAERELFAGRLRQSERLESLGRLAGGVAHDFSNLLGVIMNYNTLLTRRVTDATALADLEQVRVATDLAAGLTRQLLTFARQDQGNPEAVDVADLVRGVAEMLGRTLGEDIEISLELDSEPIVTIADRYQLEQVMLNLVVNARDAMDDGGLITIAARNGEAPPDGDGRIVLLSVTDRGHGMAPDVAARAFDPFFTTKPRNKGTGLGLATVYGIVQQHGGKVEIESGVGKGTRITVALPAADTTPDAPPKTKDLAGGHERILLVEDEPALRVATARLLRDHGYQVVEATSGGDALDLFARQDGAFDIVVTDVSMPGIRGDELARRLVDQRPGLPVVLVSGYDSGERPPMTPILAKPVTEETLLDAIREALDA